LDAIKTAEARLDGQVASQSDAAAKSLIVPPVVAPVAPVVAPISPYFYVPGIIAPGFKTFTETLINTEAPKEEKKEEVKSAEKPEEKPEENKSDSIPVESADVKAAEPKPEAQIETDSKYVVANTPLIAQLPLTPINYASPWAASPVALIQPGLKTVAALPYAGHYLTPTVLKTVW
jgi:hypothetical protein